MQVNSLYVSPLDESSPLYGDKSRFGVQVSQDAIEDTAKHLALAMMVDGVYFPLRETAWESLLDRAKINGTASFFWFRYAVVTCVMVGVFRLQMSLMVAKGTPLSFESRYMVKFFCSRNFGTCKSFHLPLLLHRHTAILSRCFLKMQTQSKLPRLLTNR